MIRKLMCRLGWHRWGGWDHYSHELGVASYRFCNLCRKAHRKDEDNATALMEFEE